MSDLPEQFSPKRILTFAEEIHAIPGYVAATPLRKVAVVFIVANPFAGRPNEDLTGMIAASPAIGAMMGQRLVAALDGAAVQSYGKGGIVGLAGEQEHANALLTTAFANPIRDAIGGGKAWISSFTKLAAPGTPIDVPMNHVADVYVRSHYDGMTIAIPGGPLPDEIALIFCAATGGRLNARVGGLTHDEAMAAWRNA